MMKKVFFKVIILGLLISNFSAYAQTTTVWVVRHAEKYEPIVHDKDPELTTDGQTRATELAKVLTPKNIQMIFVTYLKRTRLTAAPLSTQLNIKPQVYDDPDNLAKNILKNYKGKNVLVVGHHETLMPIISAFGAEPPFDRLERDDYDFLFCITIPVKGKPTVTIYRYGASHHVTDIPSKYLSSAAKK